MIGPFVSPYSVPNPYQNPWLTSPASNGVAPQWLSQPNPGAPKPIQRPAYSWSTPTDWMNSARTMGGTVKGELQKAFPGNYAHVIGWEPVKGTIRNVKQTGQVLNDVAHHRPVKDHELITFDDNMKRTASLGIATLATVGLKERIFGVGEYLGLMSWFGAMAVTPKVINSMVRLKTGVNLNQSYDSTYGQRLNLYKDPNYLPLHILSDKEIDIAAKKLGIPEGPNRRREIEDKMRQVSVQAHTWGMLAAGPATPVISGLACDLLQDPIMRGVNGVKKFYNHMEANRVLKFYPTDHKTIANKTKDYLNQLIGDVPESELSAWWKQFGQGLVKQAGLSKAMDVKIITKGTHTQKMDALVKHLVSLAEPNNPKLEKTIEFLKQQYDVSQKNQEEVISGRLPKLREKANGFLEGFEKELSAEAFFEQQRQVDTRMLNAQSTVRHYRKLFDIIQKASGKSLKDSEKATLEHDIRNALTVTKYPVVQELMMSGKQDVAKKLVNDTDTFNAISKYGKNEMRQFEEADKLMGAAPETHLLGDALKSSKLGTMWRTRVGLYLGGGILAATTLYNFTMVGRDFKTPPKKPAGGPA